MFILVRCINRNIMKCACNFYTRQEAWDAMKEDLFDWDCDGDIEKTYEEIKNGNGYVTHADSFGIDEYSAWADINSGVTACNWLILEV